MLRSQIFINNELYHIYNRGVDKRDIFSDQYDIDRFYQSMREFNSTDPIGSIFENSFKNPLGGSTSKSRLVNLVAYCFNPNHYHLILEQLVDNGISIFMQRLGGYTMYFNEKYKRSGALFQGKYKVKHITSNDYLLHLSAYINLNDQVHGFDNHNYNFEIKSSWQEYIDKENRENLCRKDIVLDQFKSIKEYGNFAREALTLMQKKKEDDKELKGLILDY